MIKRALIKAKSIIDYYIEILGDGDMTDDEKQRIEHLIKGIDVGCECDPYNGFDCGCAERSHLIDSAIEQLNEM